MIVVLDASVAIKFYAPEPDTGAALSWVRNDTRFAAPDIFLVEVLQALLRHCREGRLRPDDLIGAADELARLVDVPASSFHLMARALALAHALNHKLHDCLYLALADRIGCPLLTADERLARKTAAAGLNISIRSHLEVPS